MPDIRQTGYLDDFNRPDEDPLSWEGRWQYLYYNGVSNLELQGGTAMLFGVSGGTFQASYWAPAWFAGNVECWGETIGSHDLREGLSLFLHMSSTYSQIGENVYNGYRGRWQAPIGTNNFTIYREDGGSDVALATVDGELDTVSGMMLFRKIGNTLELWSATDYAGSDFTLRLSVDDSTYQSGFVGLGTNQDDNNPGWAGFGGGVLNRQQIYRYVSN